MKRPFRAALAAAAVALALPVTGCAALISPQQTHEYQYNGGDGAGTSLDGVDVRGLLLISNDEGKSQLFYTIVNTSQQSARVDISVGSVNRSETVAAGKTVIQDPKNAKSQSKKELIVSGLDAKPGDLTDVAVTINGTKQEVPTQVLDGSLWYYKTLAPSDAPASTAPVPSGSATSGAQDSAGAEDEATADQ